MTSQPVLIAGKWCQSDAKETFQPANPQTGSVIDCHYPVSNAAELADLVANAEAAFGELARWSEKEIAEKIASFLRLYAERIEQHKEAVCQQANLETGLAISPRLLDVELPRTTNQLRQAAEAAAGFSWTNPVLDTSNGVASVREAIGPVLVIGPNNFPLAFGSISGGDFAAAVAAGNPVIAKAHPLHPGTTRLLAQQAQTAATEAGLPEGMIQLFYHCAPEDGLAMVADKRLGAVAFTGSKAAGMALKQAADAAGTPIYLEMSSLNPVVIMRDALNARAEQIAGELSDSCILAAGQLCTKPGLVFVPQSEKLQTFIEVASAHFRERPAATLLDRQAAARLQHFCDKLQAQGAKLLSQGAAASEKSSETREADGRFCAPNRLLQISGEAFLQSPEVFQQEMFGNSTLLVIYEGSRQLKQMLAHLEGQLTACLYAEQTGQDAEDYPLIANLLKQKAGRLINDKMPTGVLVSPAMNHGGPFPATGHPGFTAVGLPASIQRFTALRCYDNVCESRLPELLKLDTCLKGVWRQINGEWVKS